MSDHDLFVTAHLAELEQHFFHINAIAELSDHLKDIRKYGAISACVAMIEGYDDRSAIGEIFIIASYDDLPFGGTKDAIDFGFELAAIARESRDASGPIRSRSRNAAAQSTLDAASHIMRTDPSQLSAFLNGRNAYALDEIASHLEKKWKSP